MVHEVSITWRHAVQYGVMAQQVDWEPEKLDCDQTETCTLLLFRPNLKIIDIRDWVLSVVGANYTLSAIFKDSRNTHLPHLLRFNFPDIDCAMLFKLTWYG